MVENENIDPSQILVLTFSKEAAGTCVNSLQLSPQETTTVFRFSDRGKLGDTRRQL
jgi:superfamily I DNA/RNA helicase